MQFERDAAEWCRAKYWPTAFWGSIPETASPATVGAVRLLVAKRSEQERNSA